MMERKPLADNWEVKHFISDMHKITDPATRHLTMISPSSHSSNTIMKTNERDDLIFVKMV
jgi:hypothetical protein